MAKPKATPIEELVPTTGAQAEEQRKTNGKKLSENSLVKEKGDGYQVVSESGIHTVILVNGKPVCTCADFEGATTIGVDKETGYKCEHIYAVKHFTLSEVGEPEKTDIVFGEGGQIDEKATAQLVDELIESGKNLTILEQLARPLPRGLIKQRPKPWKKDEMLDYIDWPTVANILDRICGENWSFEIVEIKNNDAVCAVHAALYITDGNRRVRRDGVGVSDVLYIGGEPKFELAIKAAASDALKRAAVLFGVGRELYTTEEKETGDAQPRKANFAGNVPNTNGGGDNTITPKQAGMIKGICAEKGLDPVEECEGVMGVHPEKLTRKAASDFIDHLMKSGQETAKAKW